jgi:hypothetical protein
MTPEFKSRFVALAIAALWTAVQLAIEHVTPWEKLFGGRKVGPPWTYVAGVASLGLPFSVLMILWRDGWALAAFWTVAASGGLSVFLGYDIRMRLENESLRKELNTAFKLASDLIRSVRGGGDGKAP